MRPIQRILVPIDFFEASRQALNWGVAVAERFGAGLSVLHVVEFPTALSYVFPLTSFVLEKEHTDEIKEKLGGLIPEATRRKIDYRFLVATGTVDDEILRAVQSEDADLLVTGTHGRPRISRWVLGSVTRHLLRKTSIPMVSMTRTDDKESSRSGRQDIFRRILYATDLSESAIEGLSFACELAKGFQAELIVLHVLSPLRWDYPAHLVPRDLREEHQRFHLDLAEMLESSIPETLRADPHVSWTLGEGVPSKVIPGVADDRGVDLIVINRQARGRLERTLLGTTAEGVVREARCPVLSLPVPESAVK